MVNPTPDLLIGWLSCCPFVLFSLPHNDIRTLLCVSGFNQSVPNCFKYSASLTKWDKITDLMKLVKSVTEWNACILVLELAQLLLLESICHHSVSSWSTITSSCHPDSSHYCWLPSRSSTHSSSIHLLAGSSALRDHHYISSPAKPKILHLSDWFGGSLTLDQI